LDNLFKNGRKNAILVELQINAVELREADEIGADQYAKVFTFGLTLLAVARVTLVLKAHPELVHFNEIGENKGYGILEISCRTVGILYQRQNINVVETDAYPASSPIGR